MSQPWKLLPLAAIVAVLGAFLLAPGGVTQPRTASAELACDAAHEGNLIIQIIDNNTGNPVGVAESVLIEISPDPIDAAGSKSFLDNGSGDSNAAPGVILLEEVCADDGQGNRGEYTATIQDLLGDLEDCDIDQIDDLDFAPEDNQTTTLSVRIDCDDLTPTPTATPTGTLTPTATPEGTPGAAATVTLSASPTTISSCGGTSIIIIQVLDADGDPAPAGTDVTISSTLGKIDPSVGQTTDASGSAFVFLTDEEQKGGTAKVTAKSGDAEGSVDVQIDCNLAPTATTAPPPTVSSGGVISPPNTGEAGLAAERGHSWYTFAGIVLLVLVAGGAIGIVRVRA